MYFTSNDLELEFSNHQTITLNAISVCDFINQKLMFFICLTLHRCPFCVNRNIRSSDALFYIDFDLSFFFSVCLSVCLLPLSSLSFPFSALLREIIIIIIIIILIIIIIIIIVKRDYTKYNMHFLFFLFLSLCHYEKLKGLLF